MDDILLDFFVMVLVLMALSIFLITINKIDLNQYATPKTWNVASYYERTN